MAASVKLWYGKCEVEDEEDRELKAGGLLGGGFAATVTGTSKLELGGEGGALCASSVGAGEIGDGIGLVCVATGEVCGGPELLCGVKDETRDEICSCSLDCKVSRKEWFDTLIREVSLVTCLIASFKTC